MGWMRGATCVLLLATIGAAEGELEFPVRKSINLHRGGNVYRVNGRQKIPQSVAIQVRADIRVVGGNEAVLEVEGSLQIRGQLGREVILEGIWIEPSSTFQEIRLMNVKFNGGGIRVPKGQSVRGKIIVENAQLECGFDVTLREGEVNIINTMSRETIRITGVPLDGRTVPTLKVNVVSCYFKPVIGAGPQTAYSGLLGGITITGAKKVLVRNNRLRGVRSEFIDCDKLTFDGNVVDSSELVFKQTASGAFRRTKLQKSDIYCEHVIFLCPKQGKKEFVSIDKCWFRGMEDPRKIRERVIRAGHSDGVDSGVYVRFKKINKTPLCLAGKPGS